MRRCEARVSPVFNRCVVFATDRTSYHGHPHPLATPAGVTRKSLALYYYARDPAEGGVADDHTTLFQTRPAPRSRRSALASRVLPDAVVDALRRRRHGTGEGGVTDAALSRANR
jgi:hypothetical protein